MELTWGTAEREAKEGHSWKKRSSCIILKRQKQSKKKNRFFIQTFLQAGELILIDEGVVSTLTTKYLNTNCTNCLKAVVNGHPCLKCSQVGFKQFQFNQFTGNKVNRTTEAQLFHSCNHHKQRSYQIPGGKTVKNRDMAEKDTRYVVREGMSK